MSLGDTMVQLSSELKVLPAEERKSLMKDMNFTVTVPADQGLAMKADLEEIKNNEKVGNLHLLHANYIHLIKDG